MKNGGIGFWYRCAIKFDVETTVGCSQNCAKRRKQ
jgi:hypothetical protein